MIGFDLQKIAQCKRFQNEFEDLGQLGSGGFAVVKKVRHKIEDKLYAIKIIQIKPREKKENVQEMFYKIVQEAKIHASLDHQCVVKFHGSWMELETYSQSQKYYCFKEDDVQEDTFEMIIVDEDFDSSQIVFRDFIEDQRIVNMPEDKKRFHHRYQTVENQNDFKDYQKINIFILMEICEQNLQSYLYHRNLQRSKNGSQSQKTKIDIWNQNYKMIMDITSGISYLHSKKIIHRDIKLQNIIVAEGKCKIIDFGLARKVKYWKSSLEDKPLSCNHLGKNAIEQQVQKFSSSVGTRLYSSPEQSSSQIYDFRTDIYSLAVVILMMFSHFITAHQQKQLLQSIRMKKLELIEMPSKLKQLMLQCLKNENQRPKINQIRRCIKELRKQNDQRQICKDDDQLGKMFHTISKESQKIQNQNSNRIDRTPLMELPLRY